MSLLQMSITGAVMIFAVIVIRALAINHLPKKTFTALWGIVLLRLLVPFYFPSPFSAFSLVNQYIPVPQRAVELGNANISPAPLAGLPTVGDVVQGQTAVRISPYVIIWGIGLVVCALFFIIAYFRCRREFRESLPIKNGFLTQWTTEHKLFRPIEIRQSSRISAPLTYGIFQPIILMPKNTKWDDTKQMEYILEHEFVHVRRFDAATKLLLTAALCIHWLNPLVWAMYMLSNRDMELSCDETVVRSFGDTQKSAYARTLISMEEKKNSLTPLCNNFSKNAIEERITAIMKYKKTTIVTLMVAAVLVGGLLTGFAASAVTGQDDLTPSIGHTLGVYEIEKLRDFQFDGYKDMTVAEYQEKSWQLRDTSDYNAVLEKISQNNMLYKMRYNNNQNAAFLFNILEPLTAENWKTRTFGGYDQEPGGEVQGDSATLEYNLTLSISAPDKLTVGQYDKARQAVEDSMHSILQGKTNVELQDEAGMNKVILTEIASLKSKWETPYLQISVEYDFMPLSLYEATPDYIPDSYDQEPRPYPYATEADYQSLLKLKTTDYQNQSVAAFNAALLEWANEDFERNERVNIDRGWNDFRVSLTEEEHRFVTLTALASGVENAKLVQSDFTGREREDPILGNFYLTKEINDNERTAFANLFYQPTYHISDETRLTVGERDRALAGVVNGIQQYWDNTDIDTILTWSEDSILKEVKAVAEKYSNDLIQISFTTDNIGFECMSEPQTHD